MPRSAPRLPLQTLAMCACALAGCRATQPVPFPPRPGAAVRVQSTEPGARRRAGVLVSAGPDSLHVVMRGAHDTVRLAARDVMRLDVAQGRRGNAKRGALVGAGVGALVGTAVGIASLGTSCGTVTLSDGTKIGGVLCSTVRAEDVPVIALVSAVLGAPPGALVGVFVRSDRWTPVVLPATGGTGRSGALPRPGGTRVGVSLSFGAP